MNRQGHNSIKFFVGTEVEASIMRGQRTLFVVGVQPVQQILIHAFNHGCSHIYLGANQSFEMHTEQDRIDWQHMVTQLLNGEIMITLDYDVAYHSDIMNMGLHDFDNFVPMISVKMPNVHRVNENTVIKIDDADFKYSNPGVWCHSINSLTTQDTVFTDWTQYTQDTVIE